MLAISEAIVSVTFCVCVYPGCIITIMLGDFENSGYVNPSPNLSRYFYCEINIKHDSNPNGRKLNLKILPLGFEPRIQNACRKPRSIHCATMQLGNPAIKSGIVVNQLSIKTRSPAVARMTDRTASVVKLTLTLTLTGHNLAKTGTSPLNGPIMRQNKAYRAIFCTLKTTSSFIFLLPVV